VPLLDSILASLATSSTSAQAGRDTATSQATLAGTTADTTAGQCAQGFTALAAARTAAAQAHTQAGRAAALLETISLGTFLPIPTPAQLATATSQSDQAAQAAIDADAAIAAAEPLVRANYLKCVTQFAVDSITTCASDALMSATTADNQTTMLAANAEAASLTGALNPQLHVTCAEGLVLWKQAEDQVRTLRRIDGDAQSCVNVMNAGLATGLFPMLPATVATVTGNAGQVAAKLAHANTLEDDALAAVLQAHDACVIAASAVQPLIDCVTAGIAAANAATKNLPVPAPLMGPPANLDDIAQQLIAAAGALPVSRGNDCNEGLAVLAQAATLVSEQTASANLPHLLDCTNQLIAAAPTNALIATAQAVLDVSHSGSAANIISHATQLLDPNNPATHLVWKNRFVCSVARADIQIHVTDESGDDFGSGVNVSVVNFPLSSFLPVDLPSLPPIGLTNGEGRITINVPLAPVPLPLPPGVPAAPGDLPNVDAATLHFQATHSDRADGTTSHDVNHTGLSFEVQIPVADTSL
jgi:hypothetical protein